MRDGNDAAEERAPLLSSPRHQNIEPQFPALEGPSQEEGFTRSPAAVLPIALLSALAIAATAATQIHAYASLLCDDARHCNDDERRRFAGAVATATTLANGCALLAIRGFEAISKRHSKLGLAIWLVVRSMSVGALSLGGE
jgi:hypothetical protein